MVDERDLYLPTNPYSKEEKEARQWANRKIHNEFLTRHPSEEQRLDTILYKLEQERKLLEWQERTIEANAFQEAINRVRSFKKP